MSSSTSIFQILKAIDLSYENKNFDYDVTFDLEKMNISEHRLELLLENLINDEFIQGLNLKRSISGKAPTISINTPRLTTSGLLYVEENSSMKKAYTVLKEIKGWIPGM